MDGVWIAYVSRATDLIAGARRAGRPHVDMERASRARPAPRSGAGGGAEGTVVVAFAALGWWRRRVSRVRFDCHQSRLRHGCRGQCEPDINLVADVFAWTGPSGTRRIISTGSLWLEQSGAPTISADARVIMFYSRHPASADDGRDTDDLFIVER